MSSEIKQGSIVTIDFDPSKGSEIQKRRPAVVMSRDEYNFSNNLLIVCPITSTAKTAPFLVTLTHPKLSVGSKVNTMQVYTMDQTERGQRNVKLIGQTTKKEFLEIAQHFLLNFNFPFVD